MVAVTENATFCWLAHTDAGPVMLAGVEGKRVKLRERAVLFPQALDAITLNDPVVKFDDTIKLMLFPLLAAMLQLAGTDQLYDVAPATAVTE